MVKSDIIASLQDRLEKYNNIDIDKYRDLTHDIKIAQVKIQDALKELHVTKKLAEERKQHC